MEFTPFHLYPHPPFICMEICYKGIIKGTFLQNSRARDHFFLSMAQSDQRDFIVGPWLPFHDWPTHQMLLFDAMLPWDVWPYILQLMSAFSVILILHDSHLMCIPRGLAPTCLEKVPISESRSLMSVTHTFMWNVSGTQPWAKQSS